MASRLEKGASLGNDREAELRELLDKHRLRELAMRYCRAIDRCDPVLLGTVYHADARDSHGVVFDGPAHEFVAKFEDILAPYEVTQHHITTTNYRLDGDRAQGEVYFTAYHRTHPPGAVHVTVRGRYLDRYERREGEWRISDRKLVWDSVQRADVSEAEASRLQSLGELGAKRTDFSYAALDLFARGR